MTRLPLPPTINPTSVFILADNVGYGDLGSYGGGELRGAPTPRIDELAKQGIRLTQFLVEAGCTPSRAALMTGQYSIRSGLSLVLGPASTNTLSSGAFTMAQMLKGRGYATAIFGEWHLGKETQSLPTSHGFDEYYGIPPDSTWSDSIVVPTVQLSHVTDLPLNVLLEKDPQIVEAKAGEQLRKRQTVPRQHKLDRKA
jgi:arylsulfatase A-like enzyme